ncbi:MAG: response regulator [Lysobacteraceae bacterium]|nr:MAG: response regulator [Xanthomonadaceae bacterium]
MEQTRILFVEDEAALRTLMSEALADAGMEVSTAFDGQDALAMLGGETRYDVIISDVSMPRGISGIELAAHAAELQPQARVILASGLSKAQLPPLPDKVHFLPKPYRLRDLLAAVEPIPG